MENKEKKYSISFLLIVLPHLIHKENNLQKNMQTKVFKQQHYEFIHKATTEFTNKTKAAQLQMT